METWRITAMLFPNTKLKTILVKVCIRLMCPSSICVFPSSVYSKSIELTRESSEWHMQTIACHADFNGFHWTNHMFWTCSLSRCAIGTLLQKHNMQELLVFGPVTRYLGAIVECRQKTMIFTTRINNVNWILTSYDHMISYVIYFIIILIAVPLGFGLWAGFLGLLGGQLCHWRGVGSYRFLSYLYSIFCCCSSSFIKFNKQLPDTTRMLWITFW